MEHPHRRYSGTHDFLIPIKMKKALIPLCGLLGLLTACQEEIPMVSLGIDDAYAIERMKALTLHPEFPGERYEWYLQDKQGADSLVSTERDYTFISAYTGLYRLKLHIIDAANPLEHNVNITVWEEEVAYSRYIATVHEYRPAPGQFVNQLPQYQEGDTEENMRQKAEEYISGTNNRAISLGGYGGYVTFGFDHTVVNVPGEKDFKILGNAFYGSSGLQSGGSAEPGIVMVSFDSNGNGIPDDEWYELAGSEYHKPETRHRYAITYLRPAADHVPTPIKGTAITDSSYIHWDDNDGNTGYIARNSFHSQEYFPQWLTDEQLTFTGTRLADNAVDESGTGSYYVLNAYDWGYADNHPNDAEEKISFDIAWAVDADGNQIHLPGADFIRVYTGVNQQCGWVGEISTEITGAEDLHVIDYSATAP